MILSKKDILTKIDKKELVFEPMIDGFQLQPHSVDLRLGFDFHLPKTWQLTKEGRKALTVDPMDNNVTGDTFEKLTLKPGQYFELLPEEYIVASTLEKVELNSLDVMGVLFPRSSVNRRGLAVDLSGIIDVGYNGYLMIPIINNTQKQTIRIYPGERICQIIFQTISTELSKEEALIHGLSKAKYHDNNEGFIGSRSDRDEETKYIKSGDIDALKKKYSVI